MSTKTAPAVVPPATPVPKAKAPAKPKVAKVAAAPAVEAVAAPEVPAVVPTKAKAPAKPRAPKVAAAAAPVEAAPVTSDVEPVDPSATAPAVEEITPEVAPMTSRQHIEALIKRKQDMRSELAKDIVTLKAVQKSHETELKTLKKNKKIKRSGADAAPVDPDAPPKKKHGFTVPVIVSDDLYTFLEPYQVERGAPIVRSDVTRHISSYVRENNLQNPDYGREFRADATLIKLFGEPNESITVKVVDPVEGEPKMVKDDSGEKVYTYTHMQRYLKPHYPPKKGSEAAAEGGVAEVTEAVEALAV